MDGRISVSSKLTLPQKSWALNTLKLVGLDKQLNQVEDSNGRLVAIDRFAQRLEVWLLAECSKEDLLRSPSDALRRQIAKTAVGHGFFSIWMKVFEKDLTVRRMLIQEFRGTANDCFDAVTTAALSPRPTNGLAAGSKV